MTTVTFVKDEHGNYKEFTCFGHAGFAKKRFGKYEPDILCAAISALTMNVVNGLTEIAGEQVTVTENEKDGCNADDRCTAVRHCCIGGGENRHRLPCPGQ